MALWDNLQGKWSLSHLSYADMSPNHNTLTPQGSPASATGHNGETNGGMSFSTAQGGVGNCLYISDANQVGLDFSTAMTLSVWVKATSLPASGDYSWILSKIAAPVGDYSYDLYIDGATKKVIFRLSSNGTALVSAIGATALSAGVLYHIAVVYNGTDIRIYINGTLDSNGGNNPYTYSGGIFNSVTDFTIASPKKSQVTTGTTWSWYWQGLIDDVALWSRALSASEITNVYTSADFFSPATMSGGFIAGGTSFSFKGLTKTMSGGLIAGGTFAFHIPSYAASMSGGFVAGGSATIHLGTYRTAMSGGMVMGGTFPSVFYSAGSQDITWGIWDSNNNPITGGAASTSIKVRKVSDNKLLDWNDLAFKNNGWTTSAATLAEIDATNLAGYYHKSVYVANWTDGWYQFFVRYTGSPVQNGDIEMYVKNGLVLEVRAGANLDATISGVKTQTDLITKWINNKLVESPDGTTITLYDDDNVTVLKTWTWDALTLTRFKAT